MKPHILMVITTLDPGGAEHHLLDLCRGLKSEGAEISLVWLKGEGGLRSQFKALSCPCHHIPLSWPWGLFKAVKTLKALIEKLKPDIVHSHLLKANTVAALACPKNGPRLVGSRHNDEPILKKTLFRGIHRCLSQSEQKHIVISHALSDYYHQEVGLNSQKITVIHYGLHHLAACDRPPSPPLDAPHDSEKTTLLTVCRLVPQKDIPTLLEALALMKSPAQLLIAGSGPLEQALKTQCQQMGLNQNLSFLGQRSDVPSLMAACDVFVMSSRFEGFGLVFLEAMRESRPVVATKVSAIPEVVRDGETGLLVPPGDPQGLAEALDQLCQSPQQAKAWGEAGRERLLTHFSHQKMVAETWQLYLSLLGDQA